LPARPSTHDRAAEVASRHAGRRKRGRPRSVSSTSNRSASQHSQEQQSSLAPASALTPLTAVRTLSNLMSSGLSRLKSLGSGGHSAPALHARIETEHRLLSESDDEEEVKQPAGRMRPGNNLTSQQETSLGQSEKRGRGRPAHRPLDLPPTKPLRKPSTNSADSESSQPRVRPRQRKMEQFLPQLHTATRSPGLVTPPIKQQHPSGDTPELQEPLT